MTHLLNNKNIKHYLENNPEQFRIYDIPYLQKTKKCIDNFKIKNMVSYTNYGYKKVLFLNLRNIINKSFLTTFI
jgi:hypothetical protein